jgi:cytosine deaminase
MRLGDALLPEGARADVDIVGGRIAAIANAGSAPASGEVIDLAGALLVPAFVEGHIHLDKTHWGAPRLPHIEGASVRERIAIERDQRHRVGLPIQARARALIRTLIAHGTTRARSHVDIDNDVKLANLEAVLEAREAYRDWIDIQLVAFPQSGVTTERGASELLDAALAAGADLIGGLDPKGFDDDIDGQLDLVFGLADKHGKGVDIHLHDGGEVGAAELRAIADRAQALGMQGRVVVSHAFALGALPPVVFDLTAARLAEAGVAIMTSCPGTVPVPPLKLLRAHGVNVFAGSDNVRDCWSPFGNGDMLDRAAIVAARQEMVSDADLNLAFRATTRFSDEALGGPERGLHVGAVADLVAIDTKSVADAVIERPPRSWVFRGGRVAARDGVCVVAGHD